MVFFVVCIIKSGLVRADFSDLKLRPISCDISAGRIFIILTSTLHNITANQDITASTSK